MTIQANDADSTLVDAINDISDQTGVTASLAAGAITLTADDGRAIVIGEANSGAAKGGFTVATTQGKLTLESDKAIVVGGAAAADAGLTAGTIATSGSLNSIDVGTRAGAQDAIKTTDAALRQIDAVRSDIGSTQNQLESTVRNISVTQVNVTAAESTIRDVDFAAESANLQKHNILAQSGVYAMSQANSAQQNVMRLLQ